MDNNLLWKPSSQEIKIFNEKNHPRNTRQIIKPRYKIEPDRLSELLSIDANYDTYGLDKEIVHCLVNKAVFCERSPNHICIPGKAHTDAVAVFETLLDALSHATIGKLADLDYESMDRIAICDADFLYLKYYLDNHLDVKYISFCFTAGQSGDEAAKTLNDSLYAAGFTPENGYCCIRQWPIGYQTYNEYLLNFEGEVNRVLQQINDTHP